MKTHPQTLRTVSPSLGGVWWIVIASAFWAVNGVMRKPLMETLTSIELVFFEHLLLCLYAVPVVWLHRSHLRHLTARDLLLTVVMAWGASGLATLLFTMAFQYGDANAVLLLQKVQPLFVFAFARAFLKERLPAGFGKWLLLALLGTYLLTFGFSSPFASGESTTLAGALCSIGAAALWGSGTVMGRHLLQRVSYELLAGLRFVFTMPLLFLWLYATETDWAHVSAHAFQTDAYWLLATLVIAGLAGMLFYYKGLTHVKASVATLAELAFPAVGVLLNWLVLGETLTGGQLLGFAIIWYVVHRISKKPEGAA